LLNKSYLEPFSMIIFTSPNAVSLVLQTLFDKGHDASILAGKKIYALGSGTADALLKFGIVPDGVPSRFVAEGLLSLLPRSLRNEHILIPRASIAREILPDSLRRRGAHVTVLPVYDTKKIATRDCPVQNGDYVLFTSSSVVDSFYSDKKRAALRIWPCCIGEVTAATLRRYFRGRIHIAKNAAMEALVDTLIKAAGFSHRKKNGKGR
jgi:uroporphyrinogen III methyltransferase/synthase